MREHLFLLGTGLLVAAISLGAIACGDDDDDGGDGGDQPTATESAAETPEEGVINVNLTEYIVAPSPESAPAGTVTFTAKNIGGEDHELVVIKTDLAEDELPTSEDGGVDEAGEGIDVIGEIEEFPAGEEQTASFELEAGAYVLICNIVETAVVHEGDATPSEPDGEPFSHYAEGMHAAFTVTE